MSLYSQNSAYRRKLAKRHNEAITANNIHMMAQVVRDETHVVKSGNTGQIIGPLFQLSQCIITEAEYKPVAAAAMRAIVEAARPEWNQNMVESAERMAQSWDPRP